MRRRVLVHGSLTTKPVHGSLTFVKKGLRIIHEFADRGRSGLTAEDRPAFMEMMDWVRERQDFGHVLIWSAKNLDHQDMDISEQFELESHKAGKQVHYVVLKMPQDGLDGC